MKWKLDTTHSAVDFAVKHLMISTVKGHFSTFTGTGETNPDGTVKSVEVTMDAGSIYTNDEKRDAHLRSADFFDAEKYPAIAFVSTAVQQQGDSVSITGNLAMHGVNKPVTLVGTVTPTVKDPWGNVRIGLTVSGKLNRKDWGLMWNVALETGGLMVSEEVRLNIEVEAVAVQAEVERAA